VQRARDWQMRYTSAGWRLVSSACPTLDYVEFRRPPPRDDKMRRAIAAVARSAGSARRRVATLRSWTRRPTTNVVTRSGVGATNATARVKTTAMKASRSKATVTNALMRCVPMLHAARAR
jgi:hypothetical protein